MARRAAEADAKAASRAPTSLRLSPATRQGVRGLARARGASGRRACIAGAGIDVWEVVRTLRSCGGDEVAMRALYPQLSHAQVTAALRYARAYPAEISERIALVETAEVEATETLPSLEVS